MAISNLNPKTQIDFGLSDEQKSQLTNAGLTKEEISNINNNRIRTEIAKFREKLDKMEAKLDGNAIADVKKAEEGLNPLDEEDLGLIPDEYDVEYKDLSDQNDLLMSNKEYDDAVMSDPDYANIPPPPDPNDDSISDEEWRKRLIATQDAIDAITAKYYDRRQKGYRKAYIEWMRNGQQGEEPEKLPLNYNL